MKKQRFLRLKQSLMRHSSQGIILHRLNEMICKIIVYNITVLIREFIEIGTDPELFSLLNKTFALFEK